MSRWPAKLSSRRSAGVIDRERLFERIGDDVLLVWIQGPAGAGKSTLASSYVARRKRPPLWYRVDGADVDAGTVFSFLAQGAAAMTRKRHLVLPALTPDYAPDVRGFARRFFVLFFDALPPRSALVFDGFENVPGRSLEDLLLVALAELPQGDQQLIVTSRDAPGAALAHLPAKGEMVVLGWDDLKLTADEALAIAGRRGAADEAAVRQAHESAGGWAAGLVVLLEHQRVGGEPADAPGALPAAQLFPYYLNELFTRTDAATQTLLLRIALLPDFTAHQAGALMPEADAETVLRWLVRHHFFIEHSGGMTPVYRFHPLFRDFLLELGRTRMSVAERRLLLQQAAAQLHKEGEAEAALTLLVEAEAWPQAVQRLCEIAQRLFDQGRTATIENFIAALPPAVVEADRWLLYWRGVASVRTDLTRARAALAKACAAFELEGEPGGQLLACSAVLGSYFVEFGDLHGIDRWGDMLGRLLGQRGTGMPPHLELQALSRASALMFRGHRHAATIEAAFQRTRELMARPDSPLPRLAVANFVGLVHYLRGEWAKGRQLVEETENALRRQSAMPQQLAVWHTVMARLLIWSGEPEEALDAAAKAERLLAEHRIGDFGAIAASAAVFAAVNSDQPARAEASLERMRASAQPSRTLDLAMVAFHGGVVSLAAGDAAAAAEGLRAAVERAAGCGAELLAAQFRVVFALALLEVGNPARAASELDLVDEYAAEAELPVLEHAALMVGAWLAHRAGRSMDARALLRRALAIGREHGYRVVFPWVPVALLQDLCALALHHGIDIEQVRELIRRRRVPPPSADADDWPWRISVVALGRFELRIDGEPLSAASKAPKKLLELLKLLVAERALGARGVALERICDQLWPDLDGAAAMNTFNVALHRLRRLLGDEQALVLRESRLALDAQRVWTDVGSFERVADRIDGGEARAPVERLFRVYAGLLLPEDEASWVHPPRERLHSRFLRTAGALADRQEQAGRLDDAIDLLRRVIEIDPAAEAFHYRLMKCMLALGRDAEARDASRHCGEMLARAGLRSSARTEQLRQTIAKL